MQIAYQTWLVGFIALMDSTLGLIVGNATELGIANYRWLILIIIPVLHGICVIAGNQLKTIGSPPPSTVTRSETTTIIPAK